MIKKEDFNFEDIREKAEKHYKFIEKYESKSYLYSFLTYFSMIFDGVDLMCGEDEQRKGTFGQKVNYTVFSSLFFEELNRDEFFKKKLFFKCIKIFDLIQRYSSPEGDMYSKDFHTYTTIPNEKKLIKILGGEYGSFENIFQIDEFYYAPENYIKKENGLIKYDFNKFQLHSCSISKKNSLITRKLEANYEYLCKDCNKKIVIYGYLIPWYCKDFAVKEKIVPYCDDDRINYKESKEFEKKQLYLNLTESFFQGIYNQYVAMHNAKITHRTIYEAPSFNDDFFNDDRDLDDQSQEFWDSQ